MRKKLNSIHPITQIGEDDDMCYDVLIASEEPIYREAHEKKNWKPNFVQKLIDFLEYNGFTYRVMPLPCFDYVINRGIGTCIEMKSVNDFISSATANIEKGDGETRLISQCIRMADPSIFPNELRKVLIIRDGLNKRMYEKSSIDKKGDLKTKRYFQYSPISQETVYSNSNKQKLSDFKWETIEIYPDKPIDVNRWLGFILRTQLYVRVIELGGDNHTVDFFRWHLDKAKREEADIRKGYSTESFFVGKVNAETPDHKRQQIIMQNFVKNLGAVRVHKLLSYYETLNNTFNSLKTKNDFLPASTKKDGTLDKTTDEIADEYFRIMNVKYDIEKNEEESDNEEEFDE